MVSVLARLLPAYPSHSLLCDVVASVLARIMPAYPSHSLPCDVVVSVLARIMLAYPSHSLLCDVVVIVLLCDCEMHRFDSTRVNHGQPSQQLPYGRRTLDQTHAL